MFVRLLQKEFLNYVLDLRFVIVFALCVLLSGASVLMGTRNYARQIKDHSSVTGANRRALEEVMASGSLNQFSWVGYRWNRPPAVLSPVVYGLSGKQGQEVHIQRDVLPEFEASLFATDPSYGFFEVLDFGFIVTVVLSLSVLLFTYDAICGEKEEGTLRLVASFSASRSMLAAAKLSGAVLAVLVPLGFCCLIAALVLATSPDLDMGAGDWARWTALAGVFALYLMVFAAFGLMVSALTHRRLTAFLCLLGMWTAWLFVIPNLAVRISRAVAPSTSFNAAERKAYAARWHGIMGRTDEVAAYWDRHGIPGFGLRRVLGRTFDAIGHLTPARQQQLLDGEKTILQRWQARIHPDLSSILIRRRNEMRRQRRWSAALASLSPMGAVTFLSTDLARTSYVQQERVEDVLQAHLADFAQYALEKQSEEVPNLTDFSPFAYEDREKLRDCLYRNLPYILNLSLLVIVGFAGAYVAFIRYDVR
ncbi:MAG: ABC transporter permease subunit [Candidatus Latescibacteria bacterium]|nr:ABC transporter permease subunit [Candidatus Latescibacterota bacterium]